MNTSEERDWLKMVYEQAWGQYIHEDQMSEQRDTKYLTILSLFLTAAGVLCTMVLTYIFGGEADELNKVYPLGMLAVILLIACLVCLFLKHWKAVNKTAEEYILSRLETIRAIEERVGTPICMKEPERNKEKEQQKRITKKNKEKSTTKKDNQKEDGFGSTKAIINLLSVVSYILMGLSVIAAVGVAVFL